MYCSKCGNEIKDGEAFCSKCGKNVEEETNNNLKDNHSKPENKMINVVFHRVNKLSAGVRSMNVYIDHRLVSRLGNGETIEVREKYGTHNIILEISGYASKRTVEFSREYNKVYIDVAMGTSPEILSIRNENNSEINDEDFEISNNETICSQENYNNNCNRTSPTAIASFVCSLVGLFLLGVWLGIIAICFGVMAKNHIKVFKGEKGDGLATAGIIIGIIDIVGTLFYSFTILSII